ncbi:MAG TPA: TetR family transcriptional regulator C-terminal domain-containing protein [Polyangiaceae bacterium]|jgi:TetR/AcrR family transcriptional repressor of nem operon|nr:TetR family transcriptional regulator C-terminal domain-containing protein [Polyangiaceae bacterium]
MHTTKRQLLEAGLKMLLERGYNDLGVQALLEVTGIPKGSFYHHFASKEDFALQAVDLYMAAVHQGLEACLADDGRPPLQRVRSFFEATRDSYRSDGYLGCMLGGLGQELAGVSATFREKIDGCLTTIGESLAACLTEAEARGELPAGADPRSLAMLLVNCWEGAALRSRLQRSPAPLDEMLAFYFQVAVRR